MISRRIVTIRYRTPHAVKIWTAPIILPDDPERQAALARRAFARARPLAVEIQAIAID